MPQRHLPRRALRGESQRLRPLSSRVHVHQRRPCPGEMPERRVLSSGEAPAAVSHVHVQPLLPTGATQPLTYIYNSNMPLHNCHSPLLITPLHLHYYIPLYHTPLKLPLIPSFPHHHLLPSTVTTQGLPTSCLPCPAGYLCNAVGIANLAAYTCPAGSYCLQGTRLPDKPPIACPAGTYRPSTNGTR